MVLTMTRPSCGKLYRKKDFTFIALFTLKNVVYLYCGYFR